MWQNCGNINEIQNGMQNIENGSQTLKNLKNLALCVIKFIYITNEIEAENKKKRNISQSYLFWTINLDSAQGSFSLCSFWEILVRQNSTLFKYLQEKFLQNLFYIFLKTWNSFSYKW